MDKTQMRNVAKFALKGLGTYGFVSIVHQLVPTHMMNPFERIACETAVIFAGLAFSDMMDEQLLRCDAAIDKIANGNGDFVIF